MRVWLNEVATHLKQICTARFVEQRILSRNTPEIRRLRESHLLHHPAKVNFASRPGWDRARWSCSPRWLQWQRVLSRRSQVCSTAGVPASSTEAACAEFYSRLPLRHLMLMSGRLMTASPLHGVFRAGLPAVAGRGAVRSNQLSGCPALNAVGKRPDASVRSKRVGPVASSLLDAGTDAWEYADVGVGYGTQSFDSAFPTAGIMAAEAWSATVACAVTAAQTSS